MLAIRYHFSRVSLSVRSVNRRVQDNARQMPDGMLCDDIELGRMRSNTDAKFYDVGNMRCFWLCFGRRTCCKAEKKEVVQRR